MMGNILKNDGKEILFMGTLKYFAVMLLVPEIFFAGAETPEKFNITLDYTHCTDGNAVPKECATYSIVCHCTMKFTLNQTIPGPVNLFYTLPNFNQTRTNYATSLDAGQLAGNLTMNVSPSCGDFSYDSENRTIAPCGEIADSFFFDQFVLFPDTPNSDKVPDNETGLDGIEEERKKYRNPPGDLKEAFQNFSKPKSWPIDVTNLNKNDQEKSGFQNERFIAWMKTDLKIKPAMKFDGGLAAGSYILRIRYYPSEYITGPRIVIITPERLATKELEEARLRSNNDGTELTNVPTTSDGSIKPGPEGHTTPDLNNTTTITPPVTSSKMYAVPITENHMSTEPPTTNESTTAATTKITSSERPVDHNFTEPPSSRGREPNPIHNDENTITTITPPGTSSKRSVVPITENHTSTEPPTTNKSTTAATTKITSSERPVDHNFTEPPSSKGREPNPIHNDENYSSYSTEPTTVTTKSNHIVSPTPVPITENVLTEPVTQDPRRPNPITTNENMISCDVPIWALVIIYTAVAVAVGSVIIYIALPKLKIINIDMFIW